MATDFFKQTFKPSKLVGQMYARVHGSSAALTPIGNVLEVSIEHKEEVETQPDMTKLGGGLHAEVRRVTEATLKMNLADLNLTNFMRAVQGIGKQVQGATAAPKKYKAFRGGLIALDHLSPTSVTVKVGADESTATEVNAPGNYEVRHEGIYVLPDAADIQDVGTGVDVWIGYTYGDYATIEAMTTKPAELELLFGGLNEADGGKPQVVNIWRCSQGITKSLALLGGKGFGSLDVEGSILMDPTKTGTGISRYYRISMA